jgi:large subunit ribosomal protein L30
MPEKTTRRRKPKTTKKTRTARAKKTTGGAQLKVKQVRSEIGHADTYRRTLAALGLKHYQDVVVVSDNPSMRGMLFKIRHLVEVTPEEK